MSIRTRPTFLLALAFIIIIMSLTLPTTRETQIHIVIAENSISDVYIETTLLPLISELIPFPQKTGAYTIEVEIIETGETFAFANVPIGEYVAVWTDGHVLSDSGYPPKGSFTIEVNLYRDGRLIHTFTLPVSF